MIIYYVGIYIDQKNVLLNNAYENVDLFTDGGGNAGFSQ